VSNSFREEAFSFFTHAASALVGIAGAWLLITLAHGTLEVVAVSIYAATLVAMFVSSSLHHIAHSEDGLFRKIDMTAIYLFIAGTYTPIALIAAPPTWGIPILIAAWVFAAISIALRWTIPRKKMPRKVTAGIYLAMGWMAVPFVRPLLDTLTPDALWYLAGGGLAYTAGAIIYAMGRPNPWPRVVGYHGIWHLCVMAGAALHFAVVWRVLMLF